MQAQGSMSIESGSSFNMVAQTSAELYFPSNVPINTFRIYNAYSSTYIPLDFTLPRTGFLGTLTFRDVGTMSWDYTSGGNLVKIDKALDKMKLNCTLECEALNITGPSSYTYKEYAYCVNKETTPTFCSIKQGVPQCDGFR